MFVRHSVTRNTSNISRLSNFSIIAIALLAIALIPASVAKAEVTYGPVNGGQNLWEIAEEIRPDNSISIEQFVYAIYDLNPGSFQSGNMNLLQKGAFLNIPDLGFILKTSSNEAKKQLSQHVHALDVLRADAKQLRAAKANTRKYKQQIKKLQKQLGKYQYESSPWNSTYLKLVSSKRKHAKSKRKAVKLRGLLLEKATLKTSRTSKTNSSRTNINVVNKRLGEIQSSLAHLNQSNSKLVEKIKELDTLNQRIKVLEDELGKNDDLVLQLQSTLKTVQEAIKQQKLESEKFHKRFKELEASNKAPSKTRLNNKTRMETENTPYKNVPVPAPSLQSTLFRSNDKHTDLPQKEDYNSDFRPPANASFRVIKTVFNPSEAEFESTANMTNSATTLRTNLLNTGRPSISSTTNRVTNHQRKRKENTASYTSRDYWVKLLKDKIIIMGGILNGIILIFVILRLFTNKHA